jgi:hypothetical protein
MKIYLNTLVTSADTPSKNNNNIDFVNIRPTTITNISVILLGAIHNAHTLKDSYSAVNIESAIVKMYNLNGFRHAAIMLDGDFALILYDRIRGELYCARDAYGTHALYTVPHMISDSIWEITTTSSATNWALLPGTYTNFGIDDTGIWRLLKFNSQFHNIPASNLSVIQNLWLTSVHYIQYLKYAVQKRIVAGTTYYVNYDPEGGDLQFMLAWVMQSTLDVSQQECDFFIYANSMEEVPEQWREVFGARIRIYSIAGDNMCEVSAENTAIVAAMEGETPVDYDARVSSALLDGCAGSSPTNCMRPLLDAALVDYYLSSVPLDARMTNALFSGEQSLIPILPTLFCAV